MANRNNTGRTKKSYSYRPYDTSNSFVKRITAKVSEILPQPTSWVSRLFSSSSKLNVREREELAEEEEDEEERQPPSKRICFNTTETDFSHQNNINRLSVVEADSGEISPIASSRAAPLKNENQAVPGPSGLHIRHFPISSTPAIRPPPVISSAPIILSGEATSGQRDERRRQQADDASDESESTSGCSSLVPGSRLRPEQPQATNPSTGSLQRSSSSVQKSSQSLNRSNLNLNTSSQPAFDTYVFNNPLNRSGLGKRLLGDESCFYSGNTTFGGSSARTLSPAPTETPRVVTVRPSPARQPHQDTIGSSALKILKALQQFSTPVMDAKRMPIRKSEVKKKHAQPYEELIFPSMPDLLRVKRRERELKAAEKSDQSHCPSSSQQFSLPSSSGQSQYAFRMESQKDNHIGSIKGRGKEKDFELERLPAVNLPNTVKLQLNTLPKLDLAGSKKEVAPARQPSPLKSSQPYHFSNPQEPKLSPSKTGTLSLPSPLLFEFSEPLEPLPPQKRVEPTDSISTPVNRTPLPLPHQMKNPSPNFNLKRKTESNFNLTSKSSEVEQSKKESTEDAGSTTNSVFTLCPKTNCISSPQGAKNENISTSDSRWECLKCSTNFPSSEEKCKSCNLKKGEIPLNNNAIKSFQGFSKPKDVWECKECLVQNKNAIDVCVACSTPKLGKSEAKNMFQFTSSKPLVTEVNDGNKTSFSFNSSFKPPEGSWECSACFVRNKKDLLKCAACSSDKPGITSTSSSSTKPSFSFGIPSNSFQLKTEASPNLDSNTTPLFTFGIPADSSNPKISSMTSTTEKKDKESSTSTISVTSTITTSTPLINSIKKIEGSWECSTCLVQNKKESTSCVACNTSKPGCSMTNSSDKPKEMFTFGFPSATPASSSSGFAVSAASSLASSSSNAQPTFTFSSTTPVEKDTTKSSMPMFSFTASSNPINASTSDGVKPFSFLNSDKKEENSAPTDSTNLFENKLKPTKTEEMNEDCDDKPAKKRVSFGNPLIYEKTVNNNENTNTNFGAVVPNKPNEPVSSSNFAFTPFDSSNKMTVPSSNSFFTFGSSNTSETPKPNNLEQSKPLTFGDAAQPSLTTNNTFTSLGGFKPQEPENKPFTFMANSQTTASSGGFSFNSTNQTPKFGSQVNDTKPSSLFFGQQQPTPSLAPTPAPLFGQLPQEQKPFVFNAPSQAPTQSVFSINSTPIQAPSSGNLGTSGPGGFSFSDPTMKPTFNFTGGATPGFNAAPSAVVSERKMKRGIRRVTANR